MRTYDYMSMEEFDKLTKRYIDSGGSAHIVKEGTLGYGTVILENNGKPLRQFVYEEYFINGWSSGHRLKEYRRELPKKYIKMLENSGY